MFIFICFGICLANFVVKAVPFKQLVTTPNLFGGEGYEGIIGYPASQHRFDLQQEPLSEDVENSGLPDYPLDRSKVSIYPLEESIGGSKVNIYPIKGSKIETYHRGGFQGDIYPKEPFCCDYLEVRNSPLVDERGIEDNTERAVQDVDKFEKGSPWNPKPRRPSWWNTYLAKSRETKNIFPVEESLPDVVTPPTYTKPFLGNNHRKRFMSEIKSNHNSIIPKLTSAPSKSSQSSRANSYNPEVNNNPALLSEDSNNDLSETRYVTRKRHGIQNHVENFIPHTKVQFPAKEMASGVYEMLGEASSLHQLEKNVDAEAQFKTSGVAKSAQSLEKNDAEVLLGVQSAEALPQDQNSNILTLAHTAEVLPQAQRRYADENSEYIQQAADEGKWDLKSIHFTTVSVGSLMIFLILVVMVLALRVHCRNREKTAQEWIRHPVVQPTTAASDAIQPNLKHILHPDHLQTEPIRIKAKGLLERRGSNTSLTIDLGPGSERADGLFSPSRECTPEDFLMTAGSRMSRRQLRQCLKDPRDLHAEFWQIPTNHPDKCSVPGAAAKNRYRTVLPNEDTRVVLHKAPPDSPETPASQYINANYIRGYEGEERAYVATQGPLAHTIEDLWLLVLQERSPAIVMITRLKEKGRVKCEPYIPSYATSYGTLHITVKQVIQKNGYTIRQIYMKRGDEVHTTLHFWFTSWPDHKAPSSARHLLAMASEVEQARKMQLDFFSPNHKRSIFSNQESRGPVVVHCSAGIGRTGCFIGVSIGRLQLLEEDCVDVLSIVCQMRLDRGGMVQTAEQYEFIHRALALYEASLPVTASAE